MSYRSAKRWLKLRIAISNVLDTALTRGAERLKMCGEGPRHGWSILFAQMWFTDCPCCLFYRGVTFGVSLSVAIGAITCAIIEVL